MDIKKILPMFGKTKSQELAELKTRVERMKAAMPAEITEAHGHSFKNRSELLSSELVGCFYCQQSFRPNEITEWHDEGQTGFCPHCGIDALIGSASGFKPSADFLKEMNQYWF
jgi:hypothetical protein